MNGQTPIPNQVLTIEFDREDDGRWIAEVPELPGVLVYGDSKEEAMWRVQALAYRVRCWPESRNTLGLRRQTCS